ncbi:hypothetical protein SETIT_6G012900v2 [Setaria italica]|nr:hypothetical protein SETIT_6G012900v2 [Setaria italica]
MPLRDAARSACLSRAFLHSWRCRPNLTLNSDTLCSKAHVHKEDFSNIIDSIMRNHSGIRVKILKLQLFTIACHNLDSWLQVGVTPGIEELTVVASIFNMNYNFPCSLLSNGSGNSIRSLHFGRCAFHPTAELCPLRSLTSLNLYFVHITGDELECLLSNSLVLERLVLSHCNELICLKIPCMLQWFSYLSAITCSRLQVIDNQAPNLSSLYLSGNVIGETSQMKNLTMNCSKGVCYARANLPSIMPNLETLYIRSGGEVVDTPMLPTKFLYLKHLTICLRYGTPPPFDYFSLVSFLDASPSLETLILHVGQGPMEHLHDSVLGHSSPLRQLAEPHSCSLKNVKITRFSSAKSLVELTCHILKNAVPLECLTLDTIYGFRCSDKYYGRCQFRDKSVLREAPRALEAIKTHIEDKVPARVKLTVKEPCSRCHAVPVGGW